MSAEPDQRILYQDNHLIIVNKRAGELVQGDRTGDPTLMDTIKAYVKRIANKPGDVFLGAPHRLDRPVSGVVIYTRTSKGLSRMSDLFRQRAIKKVYWAIVEQLPPQPEGTLTGYMIKNEKQNRSYVSDVEKPGHKLATLHYRHLKSSDRYHLLEVVLETGRHHQIRAQLAHAGAIIKGDLKYGAARSNPDASVSLHSRYCEFIHPVRKEPVRVTAPCPSDSLWQFFENEAET